jgi:hypothetical protein
MEEDYRDMMAREDRLTELENELSVSKPRSNENNFKHKGQTYLDISYDSSAGDEGVTTIKTYSDPERSKLVKEDKVKGRIGYTTKEDFKYIRII